LNIIFECITELMDGLTKWYQPGKGKKGEKETEEKERERER
jgi:hypothetical protein